MREIHQTPKAREDLIEAAAYLLLDSEETMRRFLKAYHEDCKRLAEMPGLGALRG